MSVFQAPASDFRASLADSRAWVSEFQAAVTEARVAAPDRWTPVSDRRAPVSESWGPASGYRWVMRVSQASVTGNWAPFPNDQSPVSSTSPHADALFDERLIALESDGRMHVHAGLPTSGVERWTISKDTQGETFQAQQHAFLDHRRRLFVLIAA